MKPGRELDALIAEKVMRHRVIRKGEEFTGFPLLLHSSGDCETGVAKEDIWQIGERSYYSPFSLPHYSTQIAAAWLVVEKFRARQTPVELYGEEWHDGGDWTCKIIHPTQNKNYGSGTVTILGEATVTVKGAERGSPSAPLAICLAALEAVGVD